MSYPLPTPDRDTVTRRRLLGQSARSTLDVYRHDRGMQFASLDRLKMLARARRMIDEAVRLEGVVPTSLVDVIDRAERERQR